MSLFNLFRKEITGYTRTGNKNNGRSTIAENTAFTFRASIQPAEPQDLIVSEDLLNKESGTVYKLITNRVLNCMTKTNVSDVVKYDGKTFNVFAGDRWTNNILNHNIYLIQEVVL